MRRGFGALLLLMLTFEGQLEAKNIVGDAKCTYGPSYWCSALQPSSECSATNYCIDQEWKSNSYPEDDDQVCKICKEMVKEARDQLESNETQTEIKEVFEGSCDLIPIKVIANECKKLADEFVVELVDTLASEMNPNTVCTVAGLCNSDRIDILLANYLRAGGNFKTDCDVCHEQAKSISLQVKTVPKDDVLDKGLELCGYMSSYSDACKIALLESFDLIYDQLTHLDFLCESSGVCSETFRYSPSMISNHRGDSLECEFCEKVIKHWVDQWKSNATEEEFKEVLEEICRKLGQPDRIKRCLHIVDDYYIPFFEYIVNTLDPRSVCAAVGLCGSSEFLQVNPQVSIDIMVPHDATPDQVSLAIPDNIEFSDNGEISDNRMSLIGGYFAPQTVLEMNRPGCVICEFVMYRLREWLQDEHTRDEMEKELNDICIHMPSSLQNQCSNFVNTYGPAVIELIINHADPKEVCSLLQLCEPDMVVDTFELNQVQQANPIKEMQAKNDNCATCQYVTAIVINGIRNKDNQDEIKNVLDSVCTLMPTSISGKCENFINGYAEEIMAMIAENLTADEICQGLGLCERKKKEDNKCVICEYVITTLDHMLEDHSNIDEIKHALEQVCMYLPKTINKECVHFVDEYTDKIADLIAHGVSPEEVCTELGLCKGNGSYIEVPVDLYPADSSEVETVEEKPLCMLCEYVVGEIDAMVENKQNEDEVREALDAICYKLPQSMGKQCASMVDTNILKIVKMFAEDLTPEKVCPALNLCSKKNLIEEDNEPIDETVEEKPLCMLCNYVIGELDDIIEDKQNEDEVREALNAVCNRLPSALSQDCADMVNTNLDKIVQMFAEDYIPEKVCPALKLCPKTVAVDDTVEEKPLCMFCEYVIGELDAMVENKQNEDEVREALEVICNKFPNTLAKKCVSVVDTNLDKIIKMFVEDYTPEKVCTGLDLCQKKNLSEEDENLLTNDIRDMLDYDTEVEEEEDVHGNGACALCEFGMTVLEKELLNNRTLDMVERAVLMMCSYLPDSVAEKCEKFVEENGDQIIHLIIDQELSPAEVCTELGLCPAVAKWDASPVGGRRCDWGPSFWCQSHFHAKACGTAEYCNRVGWNN